MNHPEPTINDLPFTLDATRGYLITLDDDDDDLNQHGILLGVATGDEPDDEVNLICGGAWSNEEEKDQAKMVLRWILYSAAMWNGMEYREGLTMKEVNDGDQEHEGPE